MTVPLITVVLDPPEISDPVNFEEKADDLLNDDLLALCTQFNTSVTAFNADTVAFSETAADAVDQLEGLLALAGFSGTSTTSMAIGTGAKTLTIQPGRAFVPPAYMLAADAAAPTTNYVFAQVTAYNSTTGQLDFTVPADGVFGSGTKTSWLVSVTGPRGPLPAKATGAEIGARTNDAKYVTAKGLADEGVYATASVSGSYAPDWSAGRNFKYTVIGNLNFGVPTGLTDGMRGLVKFVVGGSGGYTLALNAAIKRMGLAPTLPTTVGAVMVMAYEVDGSTLILWPPAVVAN